uniref:Uncharacterized protein n=1 Tax=Physcomitrium patens TaxID=3218 RepID=A0A2K1IK05_PHYPA|nr:hypothetical protein PHYPA_028295 [Physcomitrium patens]
MDYGVKFRNRKPYHDTPETLVKRYSRQSYSRWVSWMGIKTCSFSVRKRRTASSMLCQWEVDIAIQLQFFCINSIPQT